MSEELEVVEAELVENDLPAIIQQQPQDELLVDMHTVLMPGQALPTKATAPVYTKRDLYVSPETQKRMENHSKPHNTEKNYRTQQKRFIQWCDEMGRVANPCTTATYIEYVASLISRGYRPNTINSYMSGVRVMMPEAKRPGTSDARGMLNEYRKEWINGNRVRKAPAITDQMLKAMVATCDLRHPIDIRDRCVLLLGHGALNRRIELANLNIADIEVDDDFVTMTIQYSKTDQAAAGTETEVPAEPDDLMMCPVDATRAWISMLRRFGVREGAFFRALTVAGTLQSRTTATKRGDHLTGDAINDWVRGRAHRAGIKNWMDITAHGLRRGGAQAIAAAGGDPTEQGRWTPGSATVKREYLDRARSRADNPWLKVQALRKKKTDPNA